MRIYPNRFKITNLSPYYLLFGDEFWFKDKIKQQIYSEAKSQGFLEIVDLTQDISFTWDMLIYEWQSLSLFAQKKIIILELPDAKPGLDGSKTLTSITQMPDPNILFIIHGPKLKQEQTQSKWFKSLDASGCYVPCNTPEGHDFNVWLKERIASFKLSVDKDAFEILEFFYAGNLLACEQALNLLQLIKPSAVITASDLNAWLDDQSRFSVFQLSDKLLNSDVDVALHILAQLQAEGIAIQIVFWLFFKEIDILIKLKLAQISGVALSTVFSSQRIWASMQSMYTNCVSKFNLDELEYMASVCSKLESNLKFKGEENWVGLMHLTLLFAPNAHASLNKIEIY